MKIIHFERKLIYYHIALWLIYSIIQQLAYPFRAPLHIIIFVKFIITLFHAFTYYVLAILIFQVLFDKSKTIMLFSIFCLFLIFTLIYLFITEDFFPSLGLYLDVQNLPPKEFVIHSSKIYLLITIASWSFFFNQYNIKKIRDNALKSKMLLTKEISHLKGQFNSHLTFNFFNFCYSQVHRLNPNTSDKIVDFTELLRYSLTSTIKHNVPVDSEMEFIKNYIEIQKTIHKQVFCKFSTQNDFSKLSIIPHLLTNFVGSAFQRSIFNNEDVPIIINTYLKSSRFFFEINYKASMVSIKDSIKDDEPIKKILKMFYKNQYEYSTRIELQYCHIALNISVSELL